MSEYIDLKKLERKAFTSIFEDGFFDIYLGILFLGIGLLISLPESIPRILTYGLFALIIGFGLLIFFVGKKLITVPRTGIIKIGKKRKAEKKKFLLILIVLIIITGIFYFLTSLDLILFEAYVSAIVFGFFFAIPISLLANLLRIDRFYIHATLGGLSFFISELSFSLFSNSFYSFLAFLVTGIIICTIGVAFSYKFVQKYPVQNEEEMMR